MQCRQGEKSATSFVHTTTLYDFNLDCSLRYLAQVFFDNSRNLSESRQLSDFLPMDDSDYVFYFELPKILSHQHTTIRRLDGQET